SGLVMSTEAVQASRDYELSLDELNDTVDSLKVNIGTGLIPVLNEYVNAVNSQVTLTRVAKEALDAQVITQQQYILALNEGRQSEEAAIEVINRLTGAVQGAGAGFVPYSNYVRIATTDIGSARDALILLNGAMEINAGETIKFPGV